jgi:hypothetical protein
MNESDYGYSFDISYNPESMDDIIQIDTDEGCVYLTKKDLRIMMELLDAY